MGQIGNITLDENYEFSYMRVTPPTVEEAKDVQGRADLVQDVIDRLVAKNYCKEYLEDLEKLNRRYPIEYRLINGIRIY